MNYSSNTADSDDITLLAVASMWPPRTWSSLYERAVYQLDKLYRVAERSDLVVIRNRRDLESLVARRLKGEPALDGLYLIEGAHPLRSVCRVSAGSDSL